MNKSPLPHNETASQRAWTRYRRLMIGMSVTSAVAVIAALSWLSWEMGDDLTIHMIIATAAGVGLSVLLGAALMGLVFLSSGSGHDDSVTDPLADDHSLPPKHKDL